MTATRFAARMVPVLVVLCDFGTAQLYAAEPTPWLTDYRESMNQARQEKKLLLLYFHATASTLENDDFERQVVLHNEIAPLLDRFVRVRLPVSAEIITDGKPQKLLDHGAFAELRGGAGLAIIDYENEGTKHFGYVVSVLPFRQNRPIDRRKFAVLATLPPGTLTQRTLIYAVRTHPEAPQSTSGDFHPILAVESESHSNHQASINYQGHHNWEQRFHRINARLANGTLAQEVCAESWAGQGLVEAAEDCVHSWRQSSGHWGAVSSRQKFFAYDMKLGRNGVWYATGIFAR